MTLSVCTPASDFCRNTVYVEFTALSVGSEAIGLLSPFPDVGTRPNNLFAMLGKYTSVCAKRSAQKLLDYNILAAHQLLICCNILSVCWNITPVRQSGLLSGIGRLNKQYTGPLRLKEVQALLEMQYKNKRSGYVPLCLSEVFFCQILLLCIRSRVRGFANRVVLIGGFLGCANVRDLYRIVLVSGNWQERHSIMGFSCGLIR